MARLSVARANRVTTCTWCRAAKWVLREEGGGSRVVLRDLTAGDVFGEMAIFEKKSRTATVQAKGTARVLTLDKRAFLRGVHEDPSLAYRVLLEMSRWIRSLTEELARRERQVP